MTLNAPQARECAAPAPTCSFDPASRAAALCTAAEGLLTSLVNGVPIDARTLRAAMETAFGGSDADGLWSWKDAYDAGEVALILFLRRFGPAMRAKPAATRLAMLGKVAALLPTHTRRSQESQALQQFSTPVALGQVAAAAAAIGPADLVLEPSAGTGLLAIFAELAGASLVLNEIGDTRAELLTRLFPWAPATRLNAAQIHDHLDGGIRPNVVVMNPPFSAAAHVEGRVADAAYRHIASALARLAEGGRLVAITGASFSPENSAWADAFARLQERGRVVFTAAVDGSVYARHGTTTETRLTVIDRIPTETRSTFPASRGMAQDAATLLAWVEAHVPPRPALAPPALLVSPTPRFDASAASARPKTAARPLAPVASTLR